HNPLARVGDLREGEALPSPLARLGSGLALACCKVAVDVCFLSSRIYCAGSGTGPLTRLSSSTDGLSVPDRWHLTWRPRSAEGRLFVDHYLGESLGSAIEAARRAGYPWTEQMSRKMSKKVEKRGVHAARLPLEPGGTGSKLSYRSQHAQRSGDRDRAGSSHTCLRRIAAGRELGMFSCSIPPSFVLSHNMSMINTTSNWLCSGAFHSPPVPSLSIRWPLVTFLSPHVPRSSGS